MTPARVSQILRQRDSGDMTAYVDLLNESRQMDGHLHGILSQAEESIAELPGVTRIETSIIYETRRRHELPLMGEGGQ